MKETLKSIIDTNDANSIHYSLIVFGTTATTVFDIGNGFTSNKLKELIDNSTRRGDTPSFGKAFEEALRQFKGLGTRRDAEKVLVVIVDNKSRMSLGEVSSLVKQLEDVGIEVIPVAIGKLPDRTELRVLGSKEQILIEAAKDANPVLLGERILQEIVAGKILITVMI